MPLAILTLWGHSSEDSAAGAWWLQIPKAQGLEIGGGAALAGWREICVSPYPNGCVI